MLDLLSLLFVAFVFVLALKKYLDQRKANPQGLPYPPGPKPLPLLGNILDVPGNTPWITYTEWRKQYGDLVHIEALGKHIVIINSLQVATDLLEKRSHIYSDRPDMPILKLMGWDFNSGLLRYGDDWRHQRTIFHRAFKPESILAYRPIQNTKVRDLLHRLAESPKDFESHVKSYGAAIVMSILFSYETAPKNDRFVTLAEETVELLTYAVFPAAQIMNAFPFLYKLPSWFPGASFKPIAQRCHKMCIEMQNVPFDWVKRNMAAGTATPSLTSTLLEQGKESEDIIKGVAASAFAVRFSRDVVYSCYGAIPDVQKKAQAEMDEVVGRDRLPTWEDRERLPYVEGLCKELLRWQPITPLGVAHALTDNDIYGGHFIPAGSIVMGNAWAMTRDETMFPDPEMFRPERFLTPEGKFKTDSPSIAFGFGRRVCVGKYLGDATVWIAVASILSMFNVAKSKDELGRDIEVAGEFSDGLACHPLPFKCSITPRFEDAISLI